jgi:hypothetical protein
LLSQADEGIVGEDRTAPADEGHAAPADGGCAAPAASVDCALQTEGDASRPAGEDNVTEV